MNKKTAGLATTAIIALGVGWSMVDPPHASSRSPHWPAVRHRYLLAHPACEACGLTAGREVHHVLDYAHHPDRELDPTNLITLCRFHHLHIGHDPDGPDGPKRPNWKASNPNVRRDAARMLAKTTLAP